MINCRNFYLSSLNYKYFFRLTPTNKNFERTERSSLFKLFLIHLDMPVPWGLYLQDPASPIAEGIYEVHNIIMFYLILVIFLVFYLALKINWKFNVHSNKFSYKYLIHGPELEFIWTCFPIVILLLIAFPSFVLLYVMDNVTDVSMTVKCIGYQWYWSYEYSDFVNSDGETIAFDSYTIPDDMLEFGQLRKLDVDNPLILPIDTHIRFVITAGDVIHNFAVPSLGIKMDATPGRLVQVSTIIQREGLYYGQCSELCGVSHSEMSIAIVAKDVLEFIESLKEM